MPTRALGRLLGTWTATIRAVHARPDVIPRFSSTSAYQARLHDSAFWWPYAKRVLAENGVVSDETTVSAGRGGTFPTLLCGDVVVKFFGHLPFWNQAYSAEHAANWYVAQDHRILAPAVLTHGRLFDDSDAPWPYLVTARARGVNWEDASLPFVDKLAVASGLGHQLRRIHALTPGHDIATADSWSAPGLIEAARATVLPPHLVDQIGEFANSVAEEEPVLVHGDLMFRHVFVEGGRLTSMVDWGDAIAADPHYELAQLQLNLFDGDKNLLRTLLDASNWPVGRNFARQAMAQAFRRQAVGLAQHGRMDVFHKLPCLLPLDDVATLEELADLVFGV